jgi:hypothetical protein
VPSAAPAAGIFPVHVEQQHALVHSALHATATEEAARDTTRLTQRAAAAGAKSLRKTS